jgi:hypothetical protein
MPECTSLNEDCVDRYGDTFLRFGITVSIRFCCSALFCGSISGDAVQQSSQRFHQSPSPPPSQCVPASVMIPKVNTLPNPSQSQDLPKAGYLMLQYRIPFVAHPYPPASSNDRPPPANHSTVRPISTTHRLSKGSPCVNCQRINVVCACSEM